MLENKILFNEIREKLPKIVMRNTDYQSVNNSTLTVVVFNDILTGENSRFFSFDSSSNKIDIKKDGFYLIMARCQFAGNVTGNYRTLYLDFNLASGYANFDSTFNFPNVADVSQPVYCFGYTIVDMKKGDWVKVLAKQDSGGALNLTNYRSYLEVVKLK